MKKKGLGIIGTVALAIFIGGQQYRNEMNRQKEEAGWPNYQKAMLANANTLKEILPPQATEAEEACQGSYSHNRFEVCKDKMSRLTWGAMQTEQGKQNLLSKGDRIASDCSGTYSPERFEKCGDELSPPPK